MPFFIFEYGYETLIIQAQEPEHALEIYNDARRAINDLETNRYVYPDQIDGGGKRQRRDWKQYVDITMDSVAITELVEKEEDGIVFERENEI